MLTNSVPLGTGAASNCFVPLFAPLAAPPFSGHEVRMMLEHFKKNLNVDGRGAVLAARGEVPALNGCCLRGYHWHWTRDAALAMDVLQRLVDSTLVCPDKPLVDSIFVTNTVHSYASWEARIQVGQAAVSHTEPKWDPLTAKPYPESWCRPQTDGPGLRARALMQFAAGLGSSEKISLWAMIRFDLDWLAESVNINMVSCDLWEETQDAAMFWNRAIMHAALFEGHKFAESFMDDPVASSKYREAADNLVGDPLINHVVTDDDAFITECPVQGGSASCAKYNKSLDGATLLAVVHTDLVSPASMLSAKTVKAFNIGFCTAYPINQRDSADGVPGVLYGRYLNDTYGGGNPWVLITAALANLLYQAGRSVKNGSDLSPKEIEAWQDALAWRGFTGSIHDFVAAGDSVMSRLHHHIHPSDDFHLYEQIDKNVGQQYNARDLTWSYAEVLSALHVRSRVVGCQMLV